jgi:hypothetical protein
LLDGLCGFVLAHVQPPPAVTGIAAADANIASKAGAV